MAELVVHERAVKVHLSCILGFETALFQVHDDEAAEVQVVKKEIKIELVVAEFEPVLTTDKGEAAPEFEEELLDVREQAGFQFALVERLLHGQEVEEIGVLQQALGEAGVNVREGGVEIVHG